MGRHSGGSWNVFAVYSYCYVEVWELCITPGSIALKAETQRNRFCPFPNALLRSGFCPDAIARRC